ncbi:hypothetical protein [uncultured Litoreibacter sp.]|uniref:hypothetical protein n=1 Tax=uncultured Litoreibacter sp. TaxID=1392394 RepID=UPI002628D4B0|nr:hypothetical protein [uncultured Litoreibacter sp.]
MIEWKYWRWQIMRNLPAAIIAALLTAIAGWFAIDAFPINQKASARIVLERKIGMVSGPKAQRTTEEVQHLQVVIHALRTGWSDAGAETGGRPDVNLKIETARDKPTYLLIETSATDADAAVSGTHALVEQAIAVSDTTQQSRTESALAKYRTNYDLAQNQLTQGRAALSSHLAKAPATQVETLRGQVSKLRAQLLSAETGRTFENPELEKLYKELEAASGIYSDIHPKVRLLQTRIARAKAKITAPTRIQTQDLLERIQLVNDKLAEGTAFNETTRQLQREIEVQSIAAQSTFDALVSAERASEASTIGFKIIQDATITSHRQERLRDALLVALAFFTLAVAAATVALKIRFDRPIRRPVDLQRSLGISTFATLPDLGPSLG